MDKKLYDVLDICLKQIELGADIDTVLFHYPDLAGELKPILEASIKARAMAALEPAPDVVRRGRAKLLQRAAEMREAKVAPRQQTRRTWMFAFRPVVAALIVIAMFLTSGTGLVRAASTTIPGDNLYPVKRTWENVSLWFVFDPQRRTTLESTYEQERLDELQELFSEGRSVSVDFAGRVTDRANNQWLVANIPIIIAPNTEMPNQPVNVNDAVHVIGLTRPDGKVEAQRMELLPPGSVLPSSEMETETPDSESTKEQNTPEPQETQKPQETQDSDSGSGNEAQTPEGGDKSTPESSSIEGQVETVEGGTVTINGQTVDISNAEVKGTPVAGSDAKVEGYYTSDGKFIATKIEFSGGSENGTGNDNSNDNSGSGNGNDDKGSGKDDDHGGNGNSGSGGGGGDG